MPRPTPERPSSVPPQSPAQRPVNTRIVQTAESPRTAAEALAHAGLVERLGYNRQCAQLLLDRRAVRNDRTSRDTGRGELLEQLGNPTSIAQQRGLVKEVLRYGGHGFPVAPVEVEILHRGGRFREPHAYRKSVVEVLLATAHATEV
jgi:hypothetical protein